MLISALKSRGAGDLFSPVLQLINPINTKKMKGIPILFCIKNLGESSKKKISKIVLRLY
jgi:hypothetical protein